MTRMTPIAAVAALVVAAALPVQAQSSKEIDELRNELRALRAELEALKKGGAAPAAKPGEPNWGDRIEQLEIKSKDAVVGGDIGGSFRLPGSETSLRVYGHAEAQMIVDLKGTAPGDNFTNLPEQPLDRRNAGFTKGKSKLTAETSRFGIESSTPSGYGTFNTKLEADFYAYVGSKDVLSNLAGDKTTVSDNNRNRLRLRHAYGEYAGFLVGQTWSTFMDLDNLPETVDFNGPIGAPFSRRMMVRYTYGDAKAGVKYTVALEDPEDGARVPNLVARYDRSFTWGAINVRALGHEKRVGSETRRGTGFGVGASYKLSPDDLLMGQWARVNGDFDMMYGSPGYTTDANGAILFDRNDGVVLGWAHSFGPKLRSNVVLGMNRSKGDPVFDNKRLTQLHVGAIYVPMKNIELGAEYIHATRKTFDNDTGTMSRFDFMGRYSF
ncbi:DcaP family trimeric outer membrane transporter [Ideonella sp. A 288]|uniref:DcaP family trimeric outer membrane transporter n=1 Tax=Ideonella sp. A 288 TaxID=1962181 RepID=UPI001F22EFD2|nr:DcaP family trimeric outer membrane transporter [Ideonella sp. A 288]